MNQNSNYDSIYLDKSFLYDLPDKKITNYKEVRNKKILLVGGGTARDVYFLSQKNLIINIENSIEAAKVANTKSIYSILQNVEDVFPIEENYFDIVVAKDIIEHLNNPENTMNEIHRVLKKNGYLVISVPNHFYFSMRLRILTGSNLIWKTIGHDHTKLFREWNYMHRIFFTWKGFKEFIQSTHFRITKYFWDIGTLSHYNDLEIVQNYLINKNKKKYTALSYIIKVFNLLFPKRLRSKIASISPSFFSACFYIWCEKI